MPDDVTIPRPSADDEAIKFGMQTWTAQERESFFDAIARHRRAAWQVGGVTYACVAILALVVALLMAPLFYALLRRAADARS